MNNEKVITNNYTTNKNSAARAAEILLTISILADILFTFCGMIPGNKYGVSTYIASFIFFLPLTIIKTVAILQSHFRHNDWQYNYKKILKHRMGAVLLILSVDILAIIALGVIGRIFGIPYEVGFSGHVAILRSDAEIINFLRDMAGCLAIISGPAIILGSIIGIVDTIRLKNKVQ